MTKGIFAIAVYDNKIYSIICVRFNFRNFYKIQTFIYTLPEGKNTFLFLKFKFSNLHKNLTFTLPFNKVTPNHV